MHFFTFIEVYATSILLMKKGENQQEGATYSMFSLLVLVIPLSVVIVVMNYWKVCC